MIRIFKGGGLRDTSDGKLEYYGFRHPLLEQSFAKYMHEHRKMSDGSLRDSNNWWKGWDSIISLQSLVRHTEDLQALDAGYRVFELRHTDGSVEKVYSKDEIAHSFSGQIKEITEEECCNAIRFNADAYKLQILK
jgi:hypothetical protein